MSGTEQTYYMTEADIQKAESKTSKLHGGDIPAGSEAAMMQVSRLLHSDTYVHVLMFWHSPFSIRQRKTSQPSLRSVKPTFRSQRIHPAHQISTVQISAPSTSAQATKPRAILLTALMPCVNLQRATQLSERTQMSSRRMCKVQV